MRWLIALGGVLAGACVTTETSPCAQARCRENTVCALVPVPEAPGLPAEERPYCVLPAQLTACMTSDDGAACTVDLRDGTCHAGVCLDNECGNRLVDSIEVCDDGNTVSADQCSSDCASNETCGNGIVDVAAGEDCDDDNLIGHDGCASTCEVETARWTEQVYRPPVPRFDYAFVFDHVRHRGVMFGGQASSLVPAADTQEWDGARWHPTSSGLAPLPRAQHAMAYDAERRVVVLYGGSNGTVFDDTWEWNGDRWTQRIPATNAPARTNHTMAYDPIRKQVVMFGGRSQLAAELGDTWTWDGTTWTPVGGLQPPAREGAAMTFDPTTGTVVLHGGRSASSGSLDDMWELGASGWVVRMQVGSRPPARYDHSIAFDFSGQRIVLAGGTLPAGSAKDAWTYANNVWTLDNSLSLPVEAARFELLSDPILGEMYFWRPTSQDTTSSDDGSMYVNRSNQWKVLDDRGASAATLSYLVSRPAFALEPSRHRVVMFGGRTQSGDIDRTVSWDGLYENLSVAAVRPPRRHGAAMAATPSHVILFGGQASSPLGDTWRLDDELWTELMVVGPSARAGHVMAYDPTTQTSLLFGGAGAGKLQDTWTFDGSAWTERATSGTRPPHRAQAAMAYHPRRGTIVLFGGLGGTGALNDTWEWNGSSRTWTQVMVSGLLPPRRYGASLAYDAATNRLVLVGGRVGPAGADSFATDTWEASWVGNVMTWRQLATAGAFPERADFALVSGVDGFGVLALTGDSLDIFGQARPRGDVWLLSYAGGSRYESCTDQDGDNDGDGLRGCADRDCWPVCTPLCPPGAVACPALGTCGDGQDDLLETCFMCPEDVGTCLARCGNFTCDPTMESAATCPGDCS